MNNDNVEALSGLLRLLGHPIRLQVALMLYQQPHTVSELEEKLQVRQPNLSQHLAVLREAGIVASSREAKYVTYSINAGLPIQLIAVLASLEQAHLHSAAPDNKNNHPPETSESTHDKQIGHTRNQPLGDELVFATVRFPEERD